MVVDKNVELGLRSRHGRDGGGRRCGGDVESETRWKGWRGRGRNDVVLSRPEHTASVDGVRDLDLQASVVDSSDGVLVHVEDSFLGTTISNNGERTDTKKTMPTLWVPHDPGPSPE